jgi:hypothetical protein
MRFNPPQYPESAFWHGDNYVILDKVTGQAVQSDFNIESAIHACNVLNDHEIRNDRPPVYIMVPIAK